MKKGELEKFKIEQAVKVIIYVFGLTVAFVLALVQSPYAPAAFTFVGGMMGGGALEKKMSS